MMSLSRALGFGTLLLGVVPFFGRSDVVWIWMVAGQSNAPGLVQTTDGRTPLADQLALKYPGQTHSIVLHAQGGTALDPDFNAFGPSWNAAKMDGVNDANDSSLYRLLTLVQSKVTEVQNAGGTPLIQGMFWMQGYQDSKSGGSHPVQPGAANNYGAHLTDLISRVRAETGVWDLPVVIGQTCVGPNPTFGAAAYASVVRMAQASVASADPNAWLATTEISQLAPDDVHFSADGIYKLAQDMVSLMQIPEPGTLGLTLLGTVLLRLGFHRQKKPKKM